MAQARKEPVYISWKNLMWMVQEFFILQEFNGAVTKSFLLGPFTS